MPQWIVCTKESSVFAPNELGSPCERVVAAQLRNQVKSDLGFRMVALDPAGYTGLLQRCPVQMLFNIHAKHELWNPGGQRLGCHIVTAKMHDEGSRSQG